MPYLQEQVQQVQQEVDTFWQRNRKWFVIGFFVILGIAGALLCYKLFFYHAPVLGVAQVAAEAPKAENIPKLEIPPPKKLVVYEREEFIRKITVPAQVSANPQNQFTATAVITPAPYGATAVAYTNMSTGQSGISYEAKKRPWFAFGGATEIGIRGGIGSNGQQADIYARQDLLRVGSVYISGYGEATGSVKGDPGAKAMVDMSLRW